MALRLTGVPSRKLKVILSAVVVFSFALPVGLHLEKIAHALESSGQVVVNEFSANGSDDWVELYNTTDQSIDVTGWNLRDSTATNHKALTGSIAAHGFMVVDFSNYLNVNQDTIRLLNTSDAVIDTIDYNTSGAILYPGAGQTTARTWDGGSTWAVGASTQGATNDVTAPSVPTGGQPHEAFRATPEFDFTWNASSDDSGGAVRYQYRASQDSSQVGNVPDGSGAWESGILDTSSIHSAGAGDGTWYWQVRAMDAAGNKSAWSEVWNMTKDTQDPTLEVVQPSQGQVFGDNRTLTVTSVLSDNIGLENYHIYMDGIEGQPEPGFNTFSVGLTVSVMYNTAQLKHGAHTIQIDVTDKAGRKTETTRTIIIDKTAPTVAITNPDPLSTVDKTKKVTVSGVAEDDTSWATAVELHLRKMKNNGECGDNVNTLNTEVADGKWSLKYDTSGLESGKYCWAATSIDAAGNRSDEALLKYFTVDNTAPVATLNLISTSTPSASTPVSVSGSLDNGADLDSLKLFVNDKVAADLTTLVNEQGNWQYTLSEGLAQGSYTLSVVATDKYGNESTIETSPLSTLRLVVGSYIPPANSAISTGLTAGLSDPFRVPTEVQTPTVPENSSDTTTDILGVQDKNDSIADQAKNAAVAVTEAGWKLFGVMWYWWLLGAAGVASVGWGMTALARHRLAEDVL